MKIAFVGKGGSGKSSISWLMIQALLLRDHKVLAIDADHNTNLAPSLGYTPHPSTPTIHHSHTHFMEQVQQLEDKKWANIVLDNRTLPRFELNTPDEYTQNLLIPLQENLQLIIAGLGNEDIVTSGRCAHGNISPLKYYLPLLDQGDHTVVIDGVAGVDMLNFGLFAGVDALVCVYEDHINSRMVRDQIRRFAEQFSLPIIEVENKASRDTLTKTSQSNYFITDEGIRNFDITKIERHNLDLAYKILESIRSQPKNTDPLTRLRKFEEYRTSRENQPGHTM